MEHNWDSVRLGGEQGDILLVEWERGEAEVGSEQIPKFKIGSIHWSSAKVVRHKAESDTPHFSSDMRRGNMGQIRRNSEKFFKPKLN